MRLLLLVTMVIAAPFATRAYLQDTLYENANASHLRSQAMDLFHRIEPELINAAASGAFSYVHPLENVSVYALQGIARVAKLDIQWNQTHAEFSYG